MTRRERALERLERRRTWAAGRRDKAAACAAVADPYRGDIAFNTQPGHIPERARVIRATEKCFEHSSMAAHHDEKAAGIERQLASTVFSDDVNAVEALKAKITKERADVEKMKAANKIVRKFKTATPEALAALQAAGLPVSCAKLFEPDFAGRLGFPAYMIANAGANIRRMEARIVEITRQQARSQKADAAGGVVIEDAGKSDAGDFIRVIFAEKPEREIIDKLKASGFYWGQGCWTGERSKLPDVMAQT